LKLGNLEYETAKELLINLKKEFGKEDKKAIKVAVIT